MKYEIDWQFFLRVSNQQKCDKVMQRILDLLELPLSHVASEPYWKDDALFKVTAQSPFDAHTSEEALGNIMNMLRRLSSSWILGLPPEDDTWEISGRSNGVARVQGVDSIGLSMAHAKTSSLPVQTEAGFQKKRGNV